MNLEKLIGAMQIVELSATTRSRAIRELVDAGKWQEKGIAPDEVVQAIEEREATAQTIIGPGLSVPHAVISWDGEFQIYLGRSRKGVDYGTADPVHLIVLLVVGKSRSQIHLEVLADVAKLLSDEQLRRELVEARDADDIKRLLRQRAGREPVEPSQRVAVSRRSVAVVKQAVQLVESLSAQALLLATDSCASVPWEALNSWSGRLFLITTKSSEEESPERPDTHVFEIPHASLSRMDRANLGLLLAAANRLVNHRHEVVCVTGQRGKPLDSITVTTPAEHFGEMFSDSNRRSGANIPPAVILRILSLAIELAAEGREGQPVGVLFAIGDTRHVMPRTQQLVLNPFHGFSRRLRNVLDPSLAETIKEFALLDGAFIIQADGTALSAGTYLVPTSRVKNLPSGLGARHQAAAAITAETKAVAITVSQSTGTVTLFQDGATVLTLERASLTRW